MENCEVDFSSLRVLNHSNGVDARLLSESVFQQGTATFIMCEPQGFCKHHNQGYFSRIGPPFENEFLLKRKLIFILNGISEVLLLKSRTSEDP